MKKIAVLLMILILLNACGDREASKETKENSEGENYKTIRVESIQKDELVRNDISSGIIDPIKFTDFIFPGSQAAGDAICYIFAHLTQPNF